MLRIIETDGGRGGGSGTPKWEQRRIIAWNLLGDSPGTRSLGVGTWAQPASLPLGLGWGQCWAGAAGGPPGQVKKSDPLRAWRTLGWLLPGTGTPSPGEWQQERPQREEGSRWWLCCRSSSLLHNRVMGVSILEMAGMLKP